MVSVPLPHPPRPHTCTPVGEMARGGCVARQRCAEKQAETQPTPWMRVPFSSVLSASVAPVRDLGSAGPGSSVFVCPQHSCHQARSVESQKHNACTSRNSLRGSIKATWVCMEEDVCAPKMHVDILKSACCYLKSTCCSSKCT